MKSDANILYVSSTTNVIKASQYPLNPGDTIYLMNGNRGKLSIWDYSGTAQNPIYVSNHNGPVEISSQNNYCLDFYNCVNIKLAGTGTYGITIDGNYIAEGLRFLNGSSGIEISNIEIKNCNTGIKVKSNLNRNDFLLSGLDIHDCYIHDINTEGMYIGSSFYHVSNDHLLENVTIRNNIVEHTGWDGIQVGSAHSNCQVYGNIIRADSKANVSGQQSGIMINPGSRCDCYNNKIIDGHGPGIFYQGNGNSNIYNNVIIRPGKNNLSSAPRGGDGIAIWGGQNRWWSYGSNLNVFHNTIIEPINNGITFAFEPGYQGDSSLIFNNLILSPQGSFYPDSNKSFIESYLHAHYTDTGNYTSHIHAPHHFSDTLDWIPDAHAPFINWGANHLTNLPMDIDLMGNHRDNMPDAGASELIIVTSNIQHPKKKELIYPNPSNGFLNLDLTASISQFELYNTSGALVFKKESQQNIGTIQLQNYETGIYFYKIKAKNEEHIGKLVLF
ncbi:MAG: T9SS type A sorting domain-containing protein [Flavobacteriales bacterium]|nr:T9SS type A sorting domain-containing protein [Flavobacteriales bacterium]